MTHAGVPTGTPALPLGVSMSNTQPVATLPVASATTDEVYRVEVYRDALGHLTARCTCKGYHFRKTCRHSRAVVDEWESNGDVR